MSKKQTAKQMNEAMGIKSTKPDNEPAKPVTIHDSESGKSVSLSVDTFKVKVDDSDYSIRDIAEICEGTQQAIDIAKDKAENAGVLMVSMAVRCGHMSTFKALCNLLEEHKHWGKAPAGTPDHIKKLYSKSPGTWQVYKSQIIGAWEQGVQPGQTIDLTRKLSKPNKDGQTEVTEPVKMVTPKAMDKARRQAEASKEPTQAGAQAGIEVKGDGEQVTMVPPQVDDIKVLAGVLDPELAATFVRIIDAFELVDKDEQRKALRTLKGLAGRMEAATPEHKDAASKVA